jgi:hypothetical protein
MASAFSELNHISIRRLPGPLRGNRPSSNNGRDFRFAFARRDNVTDGFPSIALATKFGCSDTGRSGKCSTVSTSCSFTKALLMWASN